MVKLRFAVLRQVFNFHKRFHVVLRVQEVLGKLIEHHWVVRV